MLKDFNADFTLFYRFKWYLYWLSSITLTNFKVVSFTTNKINLSDTTFINQDKFNLKKML